MKTYTIEEPKLAKQPEAFTKGQKVSVDWHDPHGDGSYAGQGEFIRHLAEGDVGDELLADGPHVVVKCTPDDSGSIFPMSAVKVIQQAEAAQAPDFGEPWIMRSDPNDRRICNRRDEIVRDESDRHRAIACVNALAGVPDPAEFVRQAKEMREAIREAHEHLCNVGSGRGCLLGFDLDDAMPDIEAAASKLQPFLP